MASCNPSLVEEYSSPEKKAKVVKKTTPAKKEERSVEKRNPTKKDGGRTAEDAPTHEFERTQVIEGATPRRKSVSYKEDQLWKYAAITMKDCYFVEEEEYLVEFPLDVRDELGSRERRSYLFGVFDGHGPSEVSTYLRENFASTLLGNASFERTRREGLGGAFSLRKESKRLLKDTMDRVYTSLENGLQGQAFRSRLQDSQPAASRGEEARPGCPFMTSEPGDTTQGACSTSIKEDASSDTEDRDSDVFTAGRPDPHPESSLSAREHRNSSTYGSSQKSSQRTSLLDEKKATGASGSSLSADQHETLPSSAVRKEVAGVSEASPSNTKEAKNAFNAARAQALEHMQTVPAVKKCERVNRSETSQPGEESLRGGSHDSGTGSLVPSSVSAHKESDGTSTNPRRPIVRGSAALSALLIGRFLTVANAGDARLFLRSTDSTVRVTRRFSTREIFDQYQYERPSGANPPHIGIALTNAFVHYDDGEEEEGASRQRRPVTTSEPEVSVVELNLDKIEFFVLVSRRILAGLDQDDLVDSIRKLMVDDDLPLSEICRMICTQYSAYARHEPSPGSDSKVSIIIVEWKGWNRRKAAESESRTGTCASC